ncbi:hypothetical protein B0A69_14725 [Chryseobacterium shigense]|uniref:Glycosyltransferase RgtA/B/C/D-like domain-containing protein n=1 Tax=Chryseobacterium shigense TaxID=297244 RepID=A0A1N7IXF3_9FLAO|nr:hypothetical protein [Chryseobacterium shigense]PQA92302.1 hypothetical protein B0A69_14725 [Chryseobacterium shigense]SIS41749.1 hypothetical protein SAMN05421639_104711 [Chryseobacterium shigense]
MIKSIQNNIFLTSIFLVLISLPLVYFTYTLRDTFLDDSYITLTYSKHFFYEGKPWYNLADTVHGNGQTSVLWMMIQSLSFAVEDIINPIYINKGISLLLITIVLASLFQSLKKQESLTIKIFIFFFSVFYSIWAAFNISHGLETILFSTTLFLFFKYRNHKSGYFLAFLLPFIRPEAIIFILFFIADTKIFTPVFYKRALCVLASVSIYFLYTAYYYDVLIPLPFLLKSIKEFSYVKVLNFITIVIIFSPIIIFAIKNYKTKFIFYGPLFFFIIYYSFFIDEIMNFFDRYRFPLFVYYVYFFQFENVEVISHKKLNVSLWLLSTAGILHYCTYLKDHVNFYVGPYEKAMNEGPIYLGKYLKKISVNENKKFKIINSDAGAIAYFSDCYLYDTWGLNNATLLLTKINKNWNAYLSYLKKTDPDYIILISKDYHTFIPRLDFEERIYKAFYLETKHPVLVRKSTDHYYFLYKIKHQP